jgi:hypothetical protein
VTDAQHTQQSGTIELAIAEFNALRAEIVGHQSAQTTLVGATLATVGVVLGLVLTEKQTRVELLLVVPLVASGLGLLYTNHSRSSSLIGAYIEDCLWPTGMYSWEQYLRKYRSSLNPARLLEFMVGMAVFVFPSLGALIAVRLEGVWDDQDLFEATFWCGVGLMVVHVALTVVVALQSIRQPANQHVES